MQAPATWARLALCAVMGTTAVPAVSEDLLPGNGQGVLVHDFDGSGQLDCLVCHVFSQAKDQETATDHWTTYQVPGRGFSPSQICLSCHDGVIGTEPPKAGDSLALFRGTNFDIEIRNHHPYASPYSERPSLRLVDPHEAIERRVRLIKSTSATASIYSVECSSCHEVHSPGNASLLRVTATEQALCRCCHRSLMSRNFKGEYLGENSCLDCHDK